MSGIASQITSLTIVFSTLYLDTDQGKHQSSASLAFCAGNSPEAGEFPAQMASNAENVSIWWRHHDNCNMSTTFSTRSLMSELWMSHYILHHDNTTHWSLFGHTKTSRHCASRILDSPITHLFVWQLHQANNKEIMKAPHFSPFIRGTHRQILLTKGQLYGKRFHAVTSS